MEYTEWHFMKKINLYVNNMKIDGDRMAASRSEISLRFDCLKGVIVHHDEGSSFARGVTQLSVRNRLLAENLQPKATCADLPAGTIDRTPIRWPLHHQFWLFEPD